MFVERLSVDDLNDYLVNVVLWRRTYDEVRLCTVHEWHTRLGEVECRQLVYLLTEDGSEEVCEHDVVDFDKDLKHCRFMLERFGEEYLDYLHSAVKESDFDESQRARFLAQNTHMHNAIEAKKAQRLAAQQKSIFDYE